MERKTSKPYARLADVGPDSRIDGVCRDCGHVANLDVTALSLRFGENTTFEQLIPLLRCAHCGSQACRLMHRWAGYPFTYPT